ncbi:hypothetical protein [Paraburkholderia sediminicola]|uniref:hypothetical protein n=1 Tax=Paraburkholderia sediminicola TaxID=458836 RepID=UPI0038B8CECF
MSTNVLKLIAGAAAALFILILIGILSVFAFYGKTNLEPVVYEIGVLITTALGLITALAGHVAASSRAPALPPGTAATYNPPATVLNTVAGAAPIVPPIPPGAQQ